MLASTRSRPPQRKFDALIAVTHVVPKGTSMATLSQPRCNVIDRELNDRPRKRLAFKTPQECFDEI
jgi:IS30 family transposase